MNFQIIGIILFNILLAFVPIYLKNLSEYPLLNIVFIRFLFSGVINIIFSFLSIFYFNIKLYRKNPDKHLNYNLFFKFLSSKNTKFFGYKQIYYLSFYSIFGLGLQVVSFFFSLNLLGVAFTYSAIPITIILIAIILWINGREDIGFLKILYFTLLILAVGIIINEKTNSNGFSSGDIGTFSIIILILYIISRTLNYLMTKKDEMDDWEVEILNLYRHNYNFIRLLFKSGMAQFISSLSVILYAFILLFMPSGAFTQFEAQLFFNSFFSSFKMLSNIHCIFLIFLGTIIPYFIWFLTSAFWRREALSFDQWASILNLILPGMGIFLGVFLLNESFNGYMYIILIIILVCSILLRYIDETTNVVNIFLLIKLKSKKMDDFIVQMMKRTGILEINSILGDFDLFITAQLPNSRKFQKLLIWVRNTECVEQIAEFHFDKALK